MFDPDTLVASIPLPFTRGRVRIADIWHHDPCTDGSDDSCGWSFPKLTEDQRRQLRYIAQTEAKQRRFLVSPTKEWCGSALEAETLYRGMVLLVACMLRIRMTAEQATLYAARKTTGNPDIFNGSDALCFLPGYHTNYSEDREDLREDVALQRFCGIARSLLASRRRWWQHPRWHVHHWRVRFTLFRDIRAHFRARRERNEQPPSAA